MDRLFSLAGKTAIITGGGAGIGAMIARGFAERGGDVIIVGRNEARLRATAGELSELGACEAFVADIAKADCRIRLAEYVAARGKGLDILVNNAGLMGTASIDELTEKEWDRQHGVNLKGVFFLVQALLPSLRSSAPASIINIGSVAGIVTRPRELYPYISSKAGLHHLTRGLARRLGPEGIRVNAIAPGLFPSDMLTVRSGPVYDAALAAVPMGRIGQPDDIVGLATFLASDAGAFVSGTIIPLDGGMIA